MEQKNFKSLDEQIALLRSRGLHINDVTAAKQFLHRNNYYRVSGYSLTLRTHDVFSKSASFQNIVDIYEFDHELRHILLKYLEIIEVTVKSIYSYEFTKVYGATGYLDASHFTDPIKHREILSKSEAQKATRLPHEAYLKHFVEERKQDVPLWAYVDLLTISDISFLCSISEPAIKTEVANSLGITHRGAYLLGRFMHSMTIIRNLCAHGSRLYNRLFEQKPCLNRKELALLRKNTDGTVDNAHLYGFILIVKRLLSQEDFAMLKAEIIALTEKIPFVQMKYYGFPDDWKNVI
ncbi:MAG: Abi family protein [Faecousia sp.]